MFSFLAQARCEAALRTRFLNMNVPLRVVCCWAAKAWWMRRARLDDARDRVPFLDMLNASHSPLIVAQQYIASLVHGQSARLMLLWRRKAASYEDWCAVCPDEVRRLRRFILLVASSLHRRHACTYQLVQWQLVGFQSYTSKGIRRQGNRFFCRKCPCYICFNTMPCRRMPFLVHS